MRRRFGDLGMEKGTYCLGTANGPVSDTQRGDSPASVSRMAATKTQGSAMNTSAYGVVQDVGASSPVRAGLQ
jgi:hypothetical protein